MKAERSFELGAPCHHSAIHVPHRTSHPSGLVGEQQLHHVRHIRGTSHTADWMKPIEALKCLIDLVPIDKRALDGRYDDGGRDRIHPDSIFRQFHGKVLRQGMQARLSHRIGGRRRRLDRLFRPHRCNVVDRAAAVPVSYCGPLPG